MKNCNLICPASFGFFGCLDIQGESALAAPDANAYGVDDPPGTWWAIGEGVESTGGWTIVYETTITNRYNKTMC